MATTVKIGTAADLASTTAWDLRDSSANNLHLLKDNPFQPAAYDSRRDAWLETYNLFVTGDTVAHIIAGEKKVLDFIAAAKAYADDEHEDAPVYLRFYANGETAKQAVVLDAQLADMPVSNTDPLLINLQAYYRLQVWRGEWEGITEITFIDEEQMDGVTNTLEITPLKGDHPDGNRISTLHVRATSDNTEANPLTKVWMGLRKKYGGSALFNPILNLEHASTRENDTTVASIADSNTYPSGSSSNNALQCTFATQAGYKRRAVISLKDALAITDLLTNGDAETGDMTGWTLWPGLDGPLSASSTAAHVHSGTYGFVGDADGELLGSYQEIAVTPGVSYYWEFWHKVVSTDGSIYASASSYVIWLDSGGAPVAGQGDFGSYLYTTPTGTGMSVFDWTQVKGVGVAPANAAYLRYSFSARSSSAGHQIVYAMDDFVAYAVPHQDYIGTYTVLARAKLSAAGDVDIHATGGYISSDTLTPIGDPQKVTTTGWQLIALGQVEFPPGRKLTDEDVLWRIANLGFEIYAERVSGTPTLYLDCLGLVAAEISAFVGSAQICQSSFNDTGDAYSYADLQILTPPLGSPQVIAEASDFLGVDTGIDESVINWRLPHEDCLFTIFAQRGDVHTIADDFVATGGYFARYQRRNTD